MTNPEDGVWRDEERLPVSELSKAMASWDLDGQSDDVTGNDAGAEQEFGHGSRVDDPQDRGDATDPDREFRPSTTGRSGPH
jgi:hypothetical protein